MKGKKVPSLKPNFSRERMEGMHGTQKEQESLTKKQGARSKRKPQELQKGLQPNKIKERS